jgi:hypothetical protein
VTELIGKGPLTSPNGRLSFFDLRDFAESLERHHRSAAIAALREATLNPFVHWNSGFSEPESRGGSSWRWMGRKGTLLLDNPGTAPREVAFEVSLQTTSKAESALRLPSGMTHRLTTGPTPVRVKQRLILPPGQNFVEVSTDAEAPSGRSTDRADERMRVIDPLIAPVDAVALLRARSPSAG